MTDRINYLTVVLDEDYRDDDVEEITSAIKMIKGVLKVKNNVADGADYVARSRVKTELSTKLWEVLKED